MSRITRTRTRRNISSTETGTSTTTASAPSPVTASTATSAIVAETATPTTMIQRSTETLAASMLTSPLSTSTSMTSATSTTSATAPEMSFVTSTMETTIPEITHTPTISVSAEMESVSANSTPSRIMRTTTRSAFPYWLRVQHGVDRQQNVDDLRTNERHLSSTPRMLRNNSTIDTNSNNDNNNENDNENENDNDNDNSNSNSNSRIINRNIFSNSTTGRFISLLRDGIVDVSNSHRIATLTLGLEIIDSDDPDEIDFDIYSSSSDNNNVNEVDTNDDGDNENIENNIDNDFDTTGMITAVINDMMQIDAESANVQTGRVYGDNVYRDFLVSANRVSVPDLRYMNAFNNGTYNRVSNESYFASLFENDDTRSSLPAQDITTGRTFENNYFQLIDTQLSNTSIPASSVVASSLSPSPSIYPHASEITLESAQAQARTTSTTTTLRTTPMVTTATTTTTPPTTPTTSTTPTTPTTSTTPTPATTNPPIVTRQSNRLHTTRSTPRSGSRSISISRNNTTSVATTNEYLRHATTKYRLSWEAEFRLRRIEHLQRMLFLQNKFHNTEWAVAPTTSTTTANTGAEIHPIFSTITEPSIIENVSDVQSTHQRQINPNFHYETHDIHDFDSGNTTTPKLPELEDSPAPEGTPPQFVCGICYVNIVRIVGMCGHTLCVNCFHRLLQRKSPRETLFHEVQEEADLITSRTNAIRWRMNIDNDFMDSGQEERLVNMPYENILPPNSCFFCRQPFYMIPFEEVKVALAANVCKTCDTIYEEWPIHDNRIILGHETPYCDDGLRILMF